MKKYEDLVARLAQQLANAGVSIPSPDLKDSVAALHNQRSWAALEERHNRTFGHWLKTRLMGEPSAKMIKTLPELANHVRRDSLYMGQTNVEFHRKEVWTPHISRHMLIAGKEGWGPFTFIEFLVAQQILRGGGVLLINSYEDAELKGTMEQAARLAGRSEAFQALCFDAPAMAASALEKNSILHLNVPLLQQGTTAQLATHAFLRRFWTAACESGNRKVPAGQPFMVVIPNAEVLMTTEWEQWYLHARRFGICVVASTQGIPTLRRHDGDVAQIVVENSCTKLMLHQPSEQALDEAVGCLETTCLSSPEASEIRKHLKSVGMGEAIFASPDDYQNIRISMLYRNYSRQNGR